MILYLAEHYKKIIYRGISSRDNLPDLNDMTDRGPQALKPFTAYKTVSIMQLIRQYDPQSEDELLNLFQLHSKKTIESITDEVYHYQKAYFGVYKYSIETIFKYCYCCIVINSLRGNLTENQFDSWACKAGLKIRLPKTILDSVFHTDRILLDQHHQAVSLLSIKPYSFYYNFEQYIDVFEGLSFLSSYFKMTWKIYYKDFRSNQFLTIDQSHLSHEMKKHLCQSRNYHHAQHLLDQLKSLTKLIR